MWVIVIALLIGFIAAYLVGNNNGQADVQRDTSRVMAASVTDAVTQYIAGMQTMTTNGIDPSQIVFSATSNLTANPPLYGLMDPVNGAAVLQIQGAACQSPPCDAQYNVPAAGGAPTNGVTGVGSANPDYIFFVPGLTPKACAAIDYLLYKMDTTQPVPSAGSFAFETSTGNATITGGSPAWRSGQSSGCVSTTTGFTYFSAAYAQ